MAIDTADLAIWWSVSAIRTSQFDLVSGFIWKFVTSLCIRVAFWLRSEHFGDYEEGAPAPKRARTDQPELGVLEFFDRRRVKRYKCITRLSTTNDVLRLELKKYRTILTGDGPPFQNTINWRSSRSKNSEYECLSQVPGIFLACGSSLDWRECDIGILNNVLQPKRSLFGQSFVEVQMFLQLNKLIMASDPSRVRTLLNSID